MKTISTEGDLDALRQAASAWAVVLAWAKHGLFDVSAVDEVIRLGYQAVTEAAQSDPAQPA